MLNGMIYMILFVKTLDSCLRRNDTIKKKSLTLTICVQIVSHMCKNDFYVTIFIKKIDIELIHG